uniref:Uncharacterized protein n=1 Tax=Arundo donax TaxID=35708 RepID=A0A0A9D3Q8_ARUDO
MSESMWKPHFSPTSQFTKLLMNPHLQNSWSTHQELAGHLLPHYGNLISCFCLQRL